MFGSALKGALGFLRERRPPPISLESMSESDLYAMVDRYTKKEIKDSFGHDPWTLNFLLNAWEYVTKQDVLESYPWNVALPLADLCNARCTFCDSWLRGEGVMKLEEVERFVEVLRYARLIGIQGHGEPLANPRIDAILTRISEVIDRRASAYIITNGVYLEKKLDLLLRSRVKVFNISLNAATSRVHDVVMGLGEEAFASILSSIEKIVHMRDSQDSSLRVTISMVLTSDNLEEASNFIRLGNELRVSSIYLRTLMPMAPPQSTENWSEANWESAHLSPSGLNYHLLPPYRHPQFAQLAHRLRHDIGHSRVPVDANPDTWSQPVFSKEVTEYLEIKKPKFVKREEALADKELRQSYKSSMKNVTGRGELVHQVGDEGENPYGRVAPFSCRFVYQQLICTEVNFRIIPCCYMSDVPGYRSVIVDGTGNFFEYWNSQAFVDLRRRLRNGPLFSACKTCPNQG